MGRKRQDLVFDRFVLSIEPWDPGYRARAQGEAVDLPPFPGCPAPSGDDLEEDGENGSVRDVRRLESRSGQTSVEIGRKLFEWVFRGDILGALRGALATAREKNRGVTLCLQLDETPELVSLPWEALWDSKERKFLSENRDFVIARTLRKAIVDLPVSISGRPLNVAALLPEPKGLPRISVSRELRQIKQQLSSLVERKLVAVQKIEPPTLPALSRALEDDPCDVLHIAAHGEPAGPDEMGLFYLEREDGGQEEVTGVDLVQALPRGHMPRLVVLNACHGAHSRIDEAYDGLAQHLLRQGVAAVVAMRSSISDSAAVRFAASLYGHLARGDSVERALIRVRRELTTSPERREWTIPVLYLAADHIRLVDPPALSRRGTLQKLAGLTAASALGVLSWWSLSPAGPFHVPDPCAAPESLPGLRLVKIESGFFNDGDREVGVEESFCIGVYEVTRGMWREVMGKDPENTDWQDPEYWAQTINWPVTNVSFTEAQDFAGQLSARDPRHEYLLPTAEQWELAARAESKTDYFFGESEGDLDRYGNCQNELGKDGFDRLGPVGSFRPNGNGLYDVHGNAAEWVIGDSEEAKVESEKRSNKEVALKMGGSHDNNPENCKFGRQKWITAQRQSDVGFRLVREISQDEQ